MKYKLGILFFILAYNAFSQSFTAKIIDKSTKDPIPFAAIQTAEYKGVISNEDGFFNIDLEQNKISQITISSLGYKTQVFTIAFIKNNNYSIALEPSINELNTVYLTSTKPNADSIIAKAVRKLSENYRFKNINHDLFYRETSYMDFEKLDFEIKKASHVKKRQLKEANESLTTMANAVMSSNYVHFTNFMGTLSVSNDSTKLDVTQANQIINANKDFSLDNIQEKAQHIVLKYLDTTKTYKLKSGLFKAEDSLSLANNNTSEDNKQEFEIKDLKSNANNILDRIQPNPNSLLKNLLDAKYYNYTLHDVSFYNNIMVYAIQYQPKKAKAKYSGTIYIQDDSFAVLKTDYKYAKGKRGSKLNLRLILGIKYIEKASTGTIIFKKNSENWYAPRYAKHESGQYFYISRPLKFIENSRSKNKVSFNFKIEGVARNKVELLFTDSNTITASEFKTIKEAKTIPYKIQRKYDATVWGTNETIAPTEELKSFDASKN